MKRSVKYPANKLQKNKDLGQHFLVNQGVIKKIADCVDSHAKTKTVIEVGPGGGALTNELLNRGYRVLAIETDERWVSELGEKFSLAIDNKQLEIIHADAMQIDLSDLDSRFNDKQITLCGNFPYNCGQQILLRFFEEAAFVQSFVVMLQKEVVEKFFHGPKKSAHGPLSVKWALMCGNLQAFAVKPGSFSPPPKVVSSVISFCRKESAIIDPIKSPREYEKFTTLLSELFRDRRKKLHKKLLRCSLSEDKAGKWGDLRAEDLSVEDFLQIFRYTQDSKPL